uniref:CSON012388 protein n=1 Tax=Culicoides sonorensis TaxID=179676 RepID=A0A336M5C7_CULSO
MTLDSMALAEKVQAKVHQEYKILAEFKMLQSESIPGLYLIPSAESSFAWFGVIFVRQGLYQDGIFRFLISIPQEFPNTSQPPTVIFQSQVYHPSICPFTGTMDISEAFPKYSSENHLWQIAKYIIYLFEYPDQGKTVNKEAFDAWTENNAEFMAKVKECVKLSIDKLYDPAPTEDKHYIKFDKYDNELHEPVLNEMKNYAEESL